MTTTRTHPGNDCPDCHSERVMFSVRKDGKTGGYCFDCSAQWIKADAFQEIKQKRRPGRGEFGGGSHV